MGVTFRLETPFLSQVFLATSILDASDIIYQLYRSLQSVAKYCKHFEEIFCLLRVIFFIICAYDYIFTC